MITYKRIQFVLIGLLAATVLFVGGCRPDALQAPQLILPQDAAALMETNAGGSGLILLDVRTPEEFAQNRIAGAMLFDYRGPDFQEGLAQLDRSRTYLVYCRTGNRSSYAVRIMAEMGFAHVYDLDGGIVLWQAQGFPVER